MAETREQMAARLVFMADVYEDAKAEAALRAGAAALRAQGWQPIETCRVEYADSVIVATDSGVVGEARCIDGVWYWAGNDPADAWGGPISSPVTHWMPLPSPPETV